MDTAREVEVFLGDKEYDHTVQMLGFLRRLGLSNCEYQYIGMRGTPWGSDTKFGLQIYFYHGKMS